MHADLAAVARPKRPPSYSEHVCEVLRDDILSGRLPGASRLTEASVMERTGVSRTHVIEHGRRSLLKSPTSRAGDGETCSA
jgi:DNA-binding GntR family transcriptional regulator